MAKTGLSGLFKGIVVPFLAVSFAFADTVLVPQQPINFGGGLNVGFESSFIADNESPDMNNLVNDLQGSLVKRNGSRRWNQQAISTNPINSTFRIYVSSNDYYLRALLLTTRDRVYYTSSSLNSEPVFTILSSPTYQNDVWRWAMINNLAVGVADSLQEDVKKFDLTRGSFTNLFQQFTLGEGLRIRGKYPLATRNYLLLGNCAEVSTPSALTTSTTYYPTRVYYSVLDFPSSFTASRYVNINDGVGGPITGLSESNRFVHVWQETSISELDFTVLNLSALGGDQVLKTIVDGFGLFAPDSLANIGDGYIFGAKDGVRFWDGGRKTRLEVDQESRIMSDKIKPIIDRLIKAGTYKTSKGKYYPKKGWYVFSYDDPLKESVGHDSILVLDLTTLNWYPFSNLYVSSMEIFDGIGDNGEFVGGGSNDACLYFLDDALSKNDARRELSLNTMDSMSSWKFGTGTMSNGAEFVEGTASIKTVMNTQVMYSSITSTLIYPAHLWKDGSKISPNDKLNFKVRPTSFTNLSSIRVDLSLDDEATNDFSAVFTSVTIDKNVLKNGNNAWSEVSIPISSFPILSLWTDLSVESSPFATAQVYYGIRFVATGTAGGTVSFDDLRIVENKEQSLNSYFFSKTFDFGTPADKKFRKVVLNRESPRDGRMFVTSFNDFGEVVNQVVLDGGFKKEIYVTGYDGTDGITALDTNNFSVIMQTQCVREHGAFRSVVADKEFLYAGDIFNHMIWKFDRSSFSVVSSSFGSLGTGTTNFYNPFQMAVDEKKLYVVEFANHRLKVMDKDDLHVADFYGELGRGTTNLHLPTGVAVTNTRIFIADDGNQRILELKKSTYGFVREIRMPMTTLGNMRILTDEKNLYVFYGNVASTASSFTDLILEKRDLVNPETIVARTTIFPSTNAALNNGIIMGDIGQNDDFLFLSFTDDREGSGLYYVQKILKDDFSLVRELVSGNSHYGIAGNGYAYLPKRKTSQVDIGFEGSTVQMKYGENELDNNFKLYSQSFLVQPVPVKESD